MGKMETSWQMASKANENYLSQIGQEASEKPRSRQSTDVEEPMRQFEGLMNDSRRLLGDVDQKFQALAVARQADRTWMLSITVLTSFAAAAAVVTLIVCATIRPTVQLDEESLAQQITDQLVPAVSIALAKTTVPATTKRRGTTPTTAKPNMPTPVQRPR